MKRLVTSLMTAALVMAPVLATGTGAWADEHRSYSGSHRGYQSQHWGYDRDHYRDRSAHGRGYGYGHSPPVIVYVPQRPAYGYGYGYGYGQPYSHGHHGNWQRGGYLPSQYRGNSYLMRDYHRYGLYEPPRGYGWYNNGNDFVLAAVATGLIIAIIASQ